MLEAWLAARKLTAVNFRPTPEQRSARPCTPPTAAPFAELTRRRDALTLTLRSDGLDGFEDWLATHLADIHAQWRDAQGLRKLTAVNSRPGSRASTQIVLSRMLSVTDRMPRRYQGDQRRARKLTAVNARPATPAQRETLHTADGRPLTELTRRRDPLTLTLRSDGLDGFEDWLATPLSDIHAHGAPPRVPKLDSQLSGQDRGL